MICLSCGRDCPSWFIVPNLRKMKDCVVEYNICLGCWGAYKPYKGGCKSADDLCNAIFHINMGAIVFAKLALATQIAKLLEEAYKED